MSTRQKHVFLDRFSKYKALSDPNNNDSVKYDFNVNHCEGNEGLREAIKYYLQINKLAAAINLTNQPEQLDKIVTATTHGSAKISYETKRNALRNEAYDLAVNAAEEQARTAGGDANAIQAAVNNVDQPALTNEMVQAGLKNIIEDVAPHRALAKVKRYLRRFCRKPADMKIRQFVSHFTKINIA